MTDILLKEYKPTNPPSPSPVSRLDYLKKTVIVSVNMF